MSTVDNSNVTKEMEKPKFGPPTKMEIILPPVVFTAMVIAGICSNIDFFLVVNMCVL